MTPNKLAKELCKREGKKKQVNIAQIKEILGHLADIFWVEWCDENEIWTSTYRDLVALGEKRELKKDRANKK